MNHVLIGDCRTMLQRLIDDGVKVQMCVTSPPYWGLRDYGTATWEGGNPECDHRDNEKLAERLRQKKSMVACGERCDGSTRTRVHDETIGKEWQYRDNCPKCGAVRIDKQLGLEPTPEAYVAKMVEVFREVRRVLRDDGTLWLNLGSSYAGSGKGHVKHGTLEGYKQKTNKGSLTGATAFTDGDFKPKDLIPIPWMVAMALQQDGWYLRSDIIWCLSGGTWLYVRSQKGDMPMMLRDAARLDPATVQLWDGKRWAQVRSWTRSARHGDEIELVLRSGERIACTPTHHFPTERGLVEAGDLVVGDKLCRVDLPEPKYPRDCAIDDTAAWLAGLYIAEGSMAGDTIQIAGHAKEDTRWDRVRAIAEHYGGSATRTIDGNKMDIRVYGKVLVAILDELVTGKTAKDKGFAPVVWRYSNSFIQAMVEGYLSGDGHWDSDNQRWRLGFMRNYNLERDLRTACARLGWHLVLNLSSVQYNGKDVPTFRGEIRRFRSGHRNEKDSAEIVEIHKARCRYVYDVEVKGDPHLFALASGILTHNSKPNPMPESVTDRPTKSHEYMFLMSKNPKYYYDHEAVREPRFGVNNKGNTGQYQVVTPEYTEKELQGSRNLRSVWTIPTTPYSGAHFATFPPDLIIPCIKAGSRPGDVVLDPFFGSGTTGEVCNRLGRKWIGIELNEAYRPLWERRTQQESIL